MSIFSLGFGIGLIWLLLNITITVVGPLIGDTVVTNSPFAPTPANWGLSIALVLIGFVGDLADRNK